MKWHEICEKDFFIMCLICIADEALVFPRLVARYLCFPKFLKTWGSLVFGFSERFGIARALFTQVFPRFMKLG